MSEENKKLYLRMQKGEEENARTDVIIEYMLKDKAESDFSEYFLVGCQSSSNAYECMKKKEWCLAKEYAFNEDFTYALKRKKDGLKICANCA